MCGNDKEHLTEYTDEEWEKRIRESATEVHRQMIAPLDTVEDWSVEYSVARLLDSRDKQGKEYRSGVLVWTEDKGRFGFQPPQYNIWLEVADYTACRVWASHCTEQEMIDWIIIKELESDGG